MQPNVRLLFTLLALGTALCGQQPGAAAPGTTEVLAALQRTLGAESASFQGRVVRKASESDDAGGGILVVSGAPTAAPFHGRFDVLRREGAMLIASKSALPGVVIFDDGTARITRTTVGTEALDAGTLARELPDLLHAERLLRECQAAEWQIEAAADGGRRATARLRKTLIQTGVQGGPMDFLSKKVERVVATATIDGGGQLVALEFVVVRFDPNAAMRRRMIENGGGGGVKAMTPDDLAMDEDDRSDTDFEQDTYELQPVGNAVDARLQQLWDDLTQVARKDGF